MSNNASKSIPPSSDSGGISGWIWAIFIIACIALVAFKYSSERKSGPSDVSSEAESFPRAKTVQLSWADTLFIREKGQKYYIQCSFGDTSGVIKWADWIYGKVEPSAPYWVFGKGWLKPVLSAPGENNIFNTREFRVSPATEKGLTLLIVAE